MPSRVLVVDDEVELGIVLKDLLELEGYEVAVANDVASARGMLASEGFDLALLDVFINETPAGIDLAGHILTEHVNTSVVLMTGYADQADIDTACLSGVFACIAKPFDLDDVCRTVGMALDAVREAA